ncbi:glycosyltransferase 61 family protein [Sphingomonas mesophila]|uniref:glycosyltransferase 61 family protein n=1 Tax=Sphingomonas mesophila TaxID=2303576 RepID=UPI000E57BFE9|nr:glycosyltransferase 61 family protein [Sphingomonas mesophila]
MSKLISIAPLTSRLRSRISGENDIFARADQTVELSPNGTNRAIVPLSLPGEFDLISEALTKGTLGLQRQWLYGERTEHGPTLAFRYDDAILADNTVYAGGRHWICRPHGHKRALVIDDYDEIENAQLCTHIACNIFFGHWIRDAMCMELLAHERGLVPLSFTYEPWMHQAGYRTLFALPGFTTSTARVRNLWIVDDRGLNSGWSRRFLELRDRLRATTSSGGPSHVFLARGRRGANRSLINEGQIKGHLEQNGFAVIHPEEMDPTEIAHSLASARIAVSQEGSHLNHAQFALPKGAALVVIEPPHGANFFHKLLTDVSGVRFAYVVAQERENGFELAPERLMRTLDLVDCALR